VAFDRFTGRVVVVFGESAPEEAQAPKSTLPASTAPSNRTPRFMMDPPRRRGQKIIVQVLVRVRSAIGSSRIGKTRSVVGDGMHLEERRLPGARKRTMPRALTRVCRQRGGDGRGREPNARGVRFRVERQDRGAAERFFCVSGGGTLGSIGFTALTNRRRFVVAPGGWLGALRTLRPTAVIRSSGDGVR
jgi:hypothetical protein